MEDWEREIIELSAKLQALSPELKAVGELRIKFASLEKELELFRKEYDKGLDIFNNRLEDGDSKFQELSLRMQSSEDGARTLERNLREKTKNLEIQIKTCDDAIKEKLSSIKKIQDADTNTTSKRIWEIAKMIISAIIGGLTAYLGLKP